jgi:HlyD family secretion protein
MKVQDDAIRTQQATIERTKSQLDLARINYERAEQMYKSGLAAKQEYDQRKADYDSQKLGLEEANLRLVQLQSQRTQMAAQVASTQRRIAQVQAGLTRVNDVLAKHDVIAPIDGVRYQSAGAVGRNGGAGCAEFGGVGVMTIADMSLITAEVKVDETDIVNLKLGQLAQVSIDAIPDQTFSGHVIEIGNTAILRSSGQVASSSATSSTEAKDFKVVIALDSPPEKIRPGLSCTAKITTATRKDVLTIPIQALTVRQKGDLEEVDTKAQKQDNGQAPIDLVADKAGAKRCWGVRAQRR